jgi:hypothetical protein
MTDGLITHYMHHAQRANGSELVNSCMLYLDICLGKNEKVFWFNHRSNVQFVYCESLQVFWQSTELLTWTLELVCYVM